MQKVHTRSIASKLRIIKLARNLGLWAAIDTDGVYISADRSEYLFATNPHFSF